MFCVNARTPLVSTGVTLLQRLIHRIALVAVALTALLSTPAHAEWREATSEHFVVVSGGSERELVRLSQRLEAVHWMMTLLTGVQPQGTPQKVRIYLVDNIADVHEAMGVTRGNSAAGFYRPDLTGAIAVVPRSEGEFSTTILFHEYAHHFMLQYLEAAYPGWFVEGFAEFVSTASFEREGSITIGKSATHREYEARVVEWIDIPRMFAPRSASDPEAGVASYWQYWVTTHYLFLNNERRIELNRFINAVNRGIPIEEAYEMFSGGLDGLNRDVRVYSRQRSFEGRYAPLPANVMAAPTLRTLRPGEEAAIPLELKAGRRMDDEARAALATEVAALAARYPDDPVVALLQTRVLFDKQDWAGAEAAAARTLALDAANVRAKAWRGWAMLRLLEANGEDMALPRISPARAMILQASTAAPDDPLPLLAFYESFRLADQRPPLAAYDGVVRAARLAPQDDGLRMTAASAMINDRQLGQARRMLAPLAFAPHRSSQQAYALLLMRWIDAGAQGDWPTYVEMPEVVVAEED